MISSQHWIDIKNIVLLKVSDLDCGRSVTDQLIYDLAVSGKDFHDVSRNFRHVNAAVLLCLV